MRRWCVSVLVLLLVGGVVESKGEQYEGYINMQDSCWRGNPTSDPTCLEDRTGYYFVHCEGLWVKEDEQYKIVYKTQVPKPLKRCPLNHVCKCDEEYCVEANMCHSTISKFPDFPVHGVVKYAGWQATEDQYGPFYTRWNGKRARDKLGRYYKEHLAYNALLRKYRQKFELILPRKTRFIKYSGWLGNRKCKREVIKKPLTLFDSSVWSRDPKRTFTGERHGRYIQEYETESLDYSPFWYETNTYTYIYNETTNVAIPYRYHHYNRYSDSEKTETKDFVYSPVIGDANLFNIKKYCKIKRSQKKFKT